MRFNKLIVGGIVLTVILVVVSFLIFPFSPSILEDKSTNLLTTEISAPDGWYIHQMNDNFIILTRQEELPEIGNTELYAYGEQINLNEIPIDISPEAWVAQKTYIDLADVLVLKSEWSEVNGYKLLNIEREAAGAAGKVMDQYLFTDDAVHIFSLYPLESYDPVSGEQKRNLENVGVLEQILQDYVTQR